MKKFKPNILYILAVIILGISIASTALVVYADTDGKELKITTQPEKLILNLGADLAGAEFELKFDSGVFPVPVKANSSGILTMELGGSKTYILTRIKPVSATESVKPIPEVNSTDINQPGFDIRENEPETTLPDENPNIETQDATEFTNNEIKLMQTALTKWGLNAQVGQAIEECAELIVALQKFTNRTPQANGIEKILDEIADVEMMLAQIRLALDIDDETLRKRIEYKFSKLNKYLLDDTV